MTRIEAINVVENMLMALDNSSSNGEELDWALEHSGSTREMLSEALIVLGQE